MDRFEYAVQHASEDEVLREIRTSTPHKGLPAISVPPELGRLLYLLVRTSGAKRALEIGALAGYSGLWICRALGPDGRLLSLELNPEYAAVARANIAGDGIEDRVAYRLGPALHSLHALRAEGQTFDFFFIDADKPGYPDYLEACLELANPGALICADNVLLGERVLDPANESDEVMAMRRFNDQMADDQRLEAVLLPVRDGFAVARVR